MKSKFFLCFLSISACSYGQGLYLVSKETVDSLPLKWVVGGSVIFDDNVAPGSLDASGAPSKESSLGFNPYVGLSCVSVSPQTTWDVYSRLGLIYYFDAPDSMDEINSQSRLGVNLIHRFNERLRLSSRNFVSYELEPDYSYGYASSRATGEYFFWQSDNSLGYRWTKRFATYTGLRLSGTAYPEVANNDRLTWELYNQFRYQLSAQTVLTADYRYSQTMGDGVSSDSNDQYVLAGVEHRFSPNTIGIVRAGAQFHDVDQGSNTSSPYVEFALNSQINQQFSVRSFARYGIEGYDTVQGLDLVAPFNGVSDSLVEFDDRQSLRFGLSAEYSISSMLSTFAGLDYIPTFYGSGRFVGTGVAPASIPDLEENILCAYIGVSVKFNDYLTGTASYTYTNSSSDMVGRDYDRNRLSLGVSAEF